MKRAFAICFGLSLILIGIFLVLPPLMFSLAVFRGNAWVASAATNVIAVIGVIAALCAAVSCVLYGIRVLAPSRCGFPRWPRLSHFALVSTITAVTALGYDIYKRSEMVVRLGPLAVAAVGKPFELAFTAVDGRAVDLAAMRGKVVLVEFWATWCGPCTQRMPQLRAAYDRFHLEGLEIVGVSLDRDRGDLERYLAEHAIPWPQYFDGLFLRNKIAQRYDVRGVPTCFLIDKRGRLRDLNAEDELERKVRGLLAEL